MARWVVLLTLDDEDEAFKDSAEVIEGAKLFVEDHWMVAGDHERPDLFGVPKYASVEVIHAWRDGLPEWQKRMSAYVVDGQLIGIAEEGDTQ